jgi:prepilin peptidase CpaA
LILLEEEQQILAILLAVFMLTAFISDASRSLIPNVLTVSAAVGGLLYHLALDGWNGVLDSIIGLFVGFIIILVLYMFGALGAGDVKLFAALGAMMGTVFVWQSIMYSLIYAGVIGVLLLIVRKKLLPSGKRMADMLISIVVFKDFLPLKKMKQQELLQFPFMYAVLPGVCTAWFYSQV